MIVAWFPALLAVVGALAYGLGSAKISELGRIMFFVGLFVLALHTAHLTLRIG